VIVNHLTTGKNILISVSEEKDGKERVFADCHKTIANLMTVDLVIIDIIHKCVRNIKSS